MSTEDDITREVEALANALTDGIADNMRFADRSAARAAIILGRGLLARALRSLERIAVAVEGSPAPASARPSGSPFDPAVHEKWEAATAMNERMRAAAVAGQWLDFRMNALTQMVPGDPDCDACALARSYLRALEKIARLTRIVVDQAEAEHELRDEWPQPDGGK
jgi:hypothetical protein